LLQRLQSEHDDLKSELEKSKVHYGDLQKQLNTLVSEKEQLIQSGKDKDWNSNSFEQQPVVEESVTSSQNWMDVQGETGACL
jgi:flagellar biosynthesis chaperone FliJ